MKELLVMTKFLKLPLTDIGRNLLRSGWVLTLMCGALIASAQGYIIKGTVTDNLNEPLTGVSVVVKGTTTGVSTDGSGTFSLSVPAGKQSIAVSYLGMKTQEIDVDAAADLRITLLDDDLSLEEVVVIGYGTQRKEAVTGSVASMRGEELAQIPAGNISQSLQGRVAGVEMTQTSSKPGSEMQIRIRGTRSLSASNNPLIVLDGIPFPGSLNDIDPNSIKSVDILKDASATAIYGSRGANGVILVTTNRGSAGQTRLTYTGYYGVRNAIHYPMMDGPQFAKLRKEAARTITELGSASTAYTNSEDEFDNINTDWQDMLYQTGTITNHDVNFTRGTETGNYNFGLGYYLDQAVIPTQQYSRISLRASADQNFGKYIKVGFSSNSSYGVSAGGQINNGIVLPATPLADPYDANGNLKRSVKLSSTGIHKIWTKETLKDAKDVWMSDSKTLASYNNVYGELSAPWVEGLKYRVNIGMNVRMATGGSFTGIGATSASDPNAPSVASINNSLRTNWTVENLLTYDRSFGKHRVNAVGLYSAEQTNYNRSAISARDLPADHFQYFDLSKATGEIMLPTGDQAYQVSGLISYMGRVMYSYDDRYMISAALRSDASSRLAKGHKWHTYPAVSAGWNINRESFMESVGWINQLKLRAGYGETSNQSVDPYKTLGLLGTRYYNFGEDFLTGYVLSELPNEALGWEYTTTWNYGIDFSLFDNRLSGTVEYYSQHTKDILLRVGLPSTSGVGSYMANIGETSNKGIELSLKGRILDNLNGWTWDVGVNLYSNKNELLKLNSGEKRNQDNWWFVGHPINVIYDYERIGLWQESDPDYKYLQDLEPGGNAGMIKVKYTGGYEPKDPDNPNGIRPIGADDRQIIHIDPNFQGGFNTTLAYKNVDLTVVGSFQSGGQLISTIHGNTGGLNMLSGRNGNLNVDYWTPENTGAKYPRPAGMNTNDNPKYGNTMALFDASYMKVRVITLGYNFKQEWLKKVGISNLRLYATVQNPFVLFSPYHNESGLDPETNSMGDENQAITTQLQSRLAIVGYNTPATRNYLFGINLTF